MPERSLGPGSATGEAITSKCKLAAACTLVQDGTIGKGVGVASAQGCARPHTAGHVSSVLCRNLLMEVWKKVWLQRRSLGMLGVTHQLWGRAICREAGMTRSPCALSVQGKTSSNILHEQSHWVFHSTPWEHSVHAIIGATIWRATQTYLE